MEPYTDGARDPREWGTILVARSVNLRTKAKIKFPSLRGRKVKIRTPDINCVGYKVWGEQVIS